MIATQIKTTVTPSDIASIVSQSEFLFESLSDERTSDTLCINEIDAEKRLTNWCNVVARGDWEQFQKRLEWGGWSLEKVRQVLTTELIYNPLTLPKWAMTLTEIVQTTSAFNPAYFSPSPLQPDNPSPFEGILLPIIGVARQKLLDRLGVSNLSSLKCLTEAAYLSLEIDLLQNLSNLAASTLTLEFSHSRLFGQNLLNQVIKRTKTTASTIQYNTFVQKLLSDGLLTFFQKYPVLGRLIATTVDFWVEATAEFIERVQADWSDIEQTFGDVKLNKIQDIKAGLSDLHHQNRSVIALTFTSGLKLIYKPKNLGLEVTYCQFLEWCNQQFRAEDEANLPFKVLKILNRDSYGWVEYVEHQPCNDDAAARRFYRRAGMLLCLLYALGGNDCHIENLIACGEHLVLIDMETVMHHEAKLMGAILDENAILVATDQLFDSVLRTGLLPMWQFGVDNSVAYDLSALGSVDLQPIPVPLPIWKSINTDEMYQEYETINQPLQANIPVLNGNPLSPNDYVDEIVAGFEQLYRFLIGHRDTLLASDSPLSAFRSQQVRFLFRPTKIYGRVLSKAMAPECLRHGLDWSIEIDVLSRSFLATDQKPQAWPILAAELQGIGQLDVPYFSASIDSDAIILSQEENLSDYFVESCYRQIQNRLEKLDETDLAQQVAIIQLAFFARVARLLPTDPSQPSEIQLGDLSAPLLTSEQLLQQAETIASEIGQRAIPGTDGSLSWISLTFVPNAERFQVMPIEYSLYDGNCGIALFLAALAHLTGKEQWRDLTLKSIGSLSQVWQTLDTQTARSNALEMGIGGATGLGSIIYSLVKISEFLKLPHLLEDARQVANLMTPEVIASDRKFELLWGTAGGILGLLALYQKTGNSNVLAQANICGQHLLTYCESAYVLKNATPKPLTGFSHGAAGIAYSLLRLYAITQDNAYLKAAKAAIAYEDSFFYPSVGNWREIIPTDDSSASPAFWTSWCHGAPGIGLGRLGGLSIYRTESILSSVEAALNTTYKLGLQNIDHLCCGNMGRCEMMLVAAQKLSSPRWQQIAQELTAKVVQRAVQNGQYELFDNVSTSVFNPCFFQGVAGIGYQLLRLAYPELLPSILLWE